jgi:predicted esterase
VSEVAGCTRREFLGLLGGGAVLALACQSSAPESQAPTRLTARPGTPTRTVTPGVWSLGGTAGHDGFLYVPQTYVAGTATAFVLALHGAGGSSNGPLTLLSPYAEQLGFLLLAVDAYGITWDAITNGYGPDVEFLDLTLRAAFDRCSVDPARLVVEGFSDGASYALGLGLANGDLFSRIVAFSPGFIPRDSTPVTGLPEIFVSHGVQDTVLPIDGASRTIVPRLENDGYTVTYVEFDGGHTVPASVAAQATEWLMG